MSAPDRALDLREFPLPELEPGAVLLETMFAEICGTDVHLHHGRLAGVPYPIIPGHVSVGRVRAVSGEVRDVDGGLIEVGMTVTFLDVHETCGRCWYCLVAKTSTRCPSRRVYGVTYSANEGLLGGWAEMIYLKPGVRILPLPDSLPAERWIAAGCAMPTALHAIDRAEIRLGDTVVVQGAGPVGLSVAALARLSGASAVHVVDLHEDRVRAAGTIGIDHAYQIDRAAPRAHIDRVLDSTHGRGADITIEATGSPTAISEGIAMTRDGGRYVIAGHYTDTGSVPINPHLEINRKHLDIRGVWGVDLSHFYRTRSVLARHGATLAGGKPWESLISHRYSLDQINQALVDVESGQVVKGVIQPRG
ncbi:zinc-binding dehydrogenase [soil metagenome]